MEVQIEAIFSNLPIQNVDFCSCSVQISDNIMTALLQMFQSSAQSRSGGVQEDALMAVATLVEVLGDGFIKYMDAFKPYLLIGLRNTAEYQVIQCFHPMNVSQYPL